MLTLSLPRLIDVLLDSEYFITLSLLWGRELELDSLPTLSLLRWCKLLFDSLRLSPEYSPTLSLLRQRKLMFESLRLSSESPLTLSLLIQKKLGVGLNILCDWYLGTTEFAPPTKDSIRKLCVVSNQNENENDVNGKFYDCIFWMGIWRDYIFLFCLVYINTVSFNIFL